MDSCLQLNGGGSLIATCSSSSLNVQEYSGSDSCSGFSSPSSQPLNTCIRDHSSYIMNACYNAAVAKERAEKAKPSKYGGTSGAKFGDHFNHGKVYQFSKTIDMKKTEKDKRFNRGPAPKLRDAFDL